MAAPSLEEVAARFEVPGRLVMIAPTGQGNVNDTYLAVFRTAFSEHRAIIQRINTRVFQRPRWIMANLRVLTEHVHKRIEREAAGSDRIWQLPRVIPCKNGRDYYRDAAGGYWRALTLIASAASHERAQGAEHALEAGSVLGQFHHLVSDLSPRKLRDTLPGFHRTPEYLRRYDRTAAGAAGASRLRASSESRRLGAFIEARRPIAGVLESALERGELALRLIHGDPKVSNILIDDLTGKGTSIIDLDTVKPGLIHYDFGDALRSIGNPAGEETEDLSQVRFDTELCEAFAKGYIARARDFLTPGDRRYLYASIRLLAFELGLRFFEDHLAGNRYFRVSSGEHNLRRARVQFRLCESIEAREKSIRAVLDSAFSRP
ncbi:MAG: aminoglycoside phosphotransferase family protein [Elusimicrobia bacterium]|nr:aminoglycoside phosphotransferase family protein [Elusimicrobiota bacterium]MDE2236901.1 aminoglycoside phosphotransferase family protein [Elusimicrobiota bacterium]MDE2425524.1 aminoglycoside phosphotransferase family protein [Elusimicrobiota bacterium]